MFSRRRLYCRRHLRILSERDDTILCVVEPNEACRRMVLDAHLNMTFFDSMEIAVETDVRAIGRS